MEAQIEVMYASCSVLKGWIAGYLYAARAFESTASSIGNMRSIDKTEVSVTASRRLVLNDGVRGKGYGWHETTKSRYIYIYRGAGSETMINQIYLPETLGCDPTEKRSHANHGKGIP